MSYRLQTLLGMCALLITGSSLLGTSGEILAHQTHAASNPLWLARLSGGEHQRTIVASAHHRHRHAPPSPRVEQPAPPALLPVVNKKDIQMKHRILASQVLSQMPPACVAHLKHFYVRYDNPENRGLGGKSTIILDGNVPDAEFIALLIHEFGHVIDLGCLRGTTVAGPSEFKDGRTVIYQDDPSVSYYAISWANADHKHAYHDKEDFTSGYAAWNPFEDFAETFAYFILHREAFLKRAHENSVMAKKYRWMHHYFGNISVAVGKHPWDGSVHWDTTKLDYEWTTN